MDLILSLLQQMCVYLVLAYMLSKTPIFLPLLNVSSRLSHKFSCYVLFSLFCIMGTYFGLSFNDAIANTRAIGAVMGGLFGGPIVGFAVGFTGGMHRYSLGGFTDVACAISTTTEGLIGGLLHLYLVRKGKADQLFNPIVVLLVAFVAEVSQMLIIVAVAKPFDQALSLVSNIAAPMIIANSVGASLFVSILQDRKTIYEKYSATFSRRALTIAERTVGIWNSGFNANNAEQVARIIYQETRVGAVAITDKEKILAFIGIGDNHHQPNTPISSDCTLQAMQENRVIVLDGRESPYQCSISADCKLGSVLVIPLRAGKEVVGTIKLYEPKRKLLSNINRSMGEGIAQLLSSQILYGDFQLQQTLLTQAEIKLLHAQVNPHFLFNALNTINAVIRRDPDKARELIQHLSHFFRSNLKQNIETVTFKDELAHVNAYLTIEKARFTDRLEVEIDIAEALLDKSLPSFTLQPLVENAIKHGVGNLLQGGRVRIYSQQNALGYLIVVEDNAGSFIAPPREHQGLGMDIVNKRLNNFFGPNGELQIECQKDQFTRMSFLIPTSMIGKQ
ncbi:sensor histidine kinase [Vibrio sp. S11_S32]|uniref:sensor histidine kinase n=1 Tax=Vibrio sp. S11_S32 TaxID=2720225 RepID=UPI0016815715|nr:sensor histidine kinase [Vibrio sp. S11_S32]MBD1575367.1 sensor histidine kinase [Vibrio sp. S11_S32]